MKSKTIIISSQNDNEKGRGVLTIYMEDDLLKCKLRLYNTPNLNRYCKLGIYHQNEVFSANLLEKNGSYTSSMVGNFDIEKDFYSAIIDTSNNNNVILSGGTYSGYFFNDQSVFEKENKHIFDNVEKENPNTNIYSYEDNEIDYIEKNINPKSLNNSCEDDCKKCENCKYKEYFYSQKENIPINKLEENTSVQTNENVENLNQNEATKEDKEEISVISSLIPQFKYVFENYQADEILNALIPNGKFVKINENQEQFSIGAIYEDDNMKYICYAVLKDYNSPAPQELGDHYQWLPLDKEDPMSEGYYIVFQSANDLKIVDI